MNNKNKHTQNNSVALDLEYLNTKYNNLLIEYKQAMLDYTNFLNIESTTESLDPSATINPMVLFPGFSYWGTSSIAIDSSSTLQECEASCAQNSNCTGATFTSSNSLCSLRSGDGNLSISNATDYAIIPKGKQLLLEIDKINNQLTEINTQIQQKISVGQTIYNKEVPKRFTQNKTLVTQYDQLLKERKKITSMINEYQSLNTDQDDANLTTNQNYFSFILLGILAILTIFMLIKLSTSPITEPDGKLSINTFYFILTIIIFIFGINIYKELIMSFYTYITNMQTIKTFMTLTSNLYNST